MESFIPIPARRFSPLCRFDEIGVLGPNTGPPVIGPPTEDGADALGPVNDGLCDGGGDEGLDSFAAVVDKDLDDREAWN